MVGLRLRCHGAAIALLLLLEAAVVQPSFAHVLKFGNTTHGWVELVSWKPRAQLFHGFLSHAECDHIIKVASPKLERSTVVGATGDSTLDDIRTSSGTFVSKGHDDVIAAIEERVAAATQLPVPHQEDLQVLRYELGQKYSAHWDINDSKERLELMKAKGVGGGLRTVTFLMYLSDVEEGGETAFPNGRWLDGSVQAQPPYTECASKGVSVRPAKGDAILFYSLKPDGRKDPYSLHAGCPVVRGTKYSATKWIHVEPFGHINPAAEQSGTGCADDHAQCAAWAAAGECDKNPAFMKGGSGVVGSCRLSCGVCRACQPGDVLCERENARGAAR